MERYMMILKSIKRMNPELEQALRDSVYPIIIQKHELFQIPFARKEHLYFIEKGIFRYFFVLNRKEYTLEFKKEDQFIIGLREDDHVHQHVGLGIEALENAILWCIPGDLVKRLRENYPRFVFHYHGILSRDFVEWSRAKNCTHPWGYMGNFHGLRKEFPELIDRVPIRYLANFTQIQEKVLLHLLQSNIWLHNALTRHRSKPKRAK